MEQIHEWESLKEQLRSRSVAVQILNWPLQSFKLELLSDIPRTFPPAFGAVETRHPSELNLENVEYQ